MVCRREDGLLRATNVFSVRERERKRKGERHREIEREGENHVCVKGEKRREGDERGDMKRGGTRVVALAWVPPSFPTQGPTGSRSGAHTRQVRVTTHPGSESTTFVEQRQQVATRLPKLF